MKLLASDLPGSRVKRNCLADRGTKFSECSECSKLSTGQYFAKLAANAAFSVDLASSRAIDLLSRARACALRGSPGIIEPCVSGGVRGTCGIVGKIRRSVAWREKF